MFYIQTTIEIANELMTMMTADVIDKLEDILIDNDLPMTKEIEEAVLKEALKTLTEKA